LIAINYYSTLLRLLRQAIIDILHEYLTFLAWQDATVATL